MSAEAISFLKWLRADGPWLLTAIIPDGKTETETLTRDDDLAEFIARHDGKRNLYYSPNPVAKAMSKKAQKQDIAAAVVIHADLDPQGTETPEQAKDRILKATEASGLPKPSAAIDSGNGIQLLWRLAEPLRPAIAVEAHNKAVLQILGDTDGTWNVDRILRLPGTTNLPTKKKREKGRVACASSIVWMNGKIYAAGDFPAAAEREKSKTKTEMPNGDLPDVDVDSLPCTDAVKKIIRDGGGDKFKSRSEAVWHVAYELIRSGVDELTAIAVLLDPGLKISEHVLDQGDPRRAAARTVMRAKLSVEARASVAAFSESALALTFAERHEHEFRYVEEWGRWMRWDGTRWAHERTLLASDLAHRICREAAKEMRAQGSNASTRPIASAKTVAGVVTLARADRRIAATAEAWDADPWLLNTPGGVVDLRTGKTRPSEPEDYMTKVTAVAPDEGCSIKLWLSVLRRAMNDDDEMVAYLQRLFGYALTGVTIEEIFIFFHGEGANSKTKIVEAISGCMGDYHTNTPMETFLASHNERHPTEIADLCGARMVTAVETDEGRRWDEAKIKYLTGGDKLKARFMRKDLFEFEPQFTPFVHGNKKPRLRSVDEAMRRRLHLVPFEVTIPERERDKKLGEKLKREWPGILAWMIVGCTEWQRIGLSPPAKVTNATEAYFGSQDTMSQWIEECCTLDKNQKTKRVALWLSWKDWAQVTGEYVGNSRDFYEALEKRGLEQIKVRGELQFRGISAVKAPPADPNSTM